MDIDFAIAALLASIAAVVVAGLRRVPEGRAHTLHRRGRFIRVLRPGIHFTVPVLDQVAHEVELLGHHVELPLLSASSQAELFFQILDPEQAGEALDEVDELVRRLAEERLRQLASAAPAEPQTLLSRLKDELNTRLRMRGLRITRCQLA